MTSFLVRIPVIGFRVTLIQYDFMLTWLHLQWPYFQISSHSQATRGISTWMLFFLRMQFKSYPPHILLLTLSVCKIHFENGMNTCLGGQWVWISMVLFLCNVLWFISHLTSPLIHSWYYLGKRKRPLSLWAVPPYPLILWPASKSSSSSFIIPSFLSCQNLKIEFSKYLLVYTHCSHPL